MSHLSYDKIPKTRHGRGLGATFVNVGTPFVNLERVQLETSNSVCREILACHISCMIKYLKRGVVEYIGQIYKYWNPIHTF